MDTKLASDLRDALAHLYDHAYLETHALAAKIAANRSSTARTRAQETRRVLLDAIELLNPGDNVPLRAPERRAYEVLFGLYVEGREPHEVADSLGIGERQLRRDRATAAEALAVIMLDRYPILAAQEQDTAAESAASSTERAASEQAVTEQAASEESIRVENLGRESRRLAHQFEPVELGRFFDKLLPLLGGLARQHHVELVAEIPPSLPPLPLSYPLLRQIVLSLASQSIHHLPIQCMTFLAEVTSQHIGIGLDLVYPADVYSTNRARQLEDAERQVTEDSAVQTMLAALEGRIQWEAQSADRHRLWVFLPRWQKMTVLVVDDKQDLFELFLRYLAGHPYQLRHAAGVDQGLRMAQDAPPDMILLDLMMPERDGWEFLQALRTDPTLAPIPVIVCSVLHEPELAFSLGAQHYLKKPVTADELVQTLERVRWQVWEGGANLAAPAPGQSRPSY